MAEPLLAQVRALHGLGPEWLDSFLADLIDVTGCRDEVMILLRTYSDLSKGYVRGRRP